MEYQFKTLYSEIGGQETINKLVEAFYPRVYADPELRPLFEGIWKKSSGSSECFCRNF